MEISERSLGRSHPSTLISLSNFGRTHLVLRRFAEAEELLAEAAEGLLEQQLENEVTAITLHCWGDCLLRLDRVEEALEKYLAALDLLEVHPAADESQMEILLRSIDRCQSELDGG